MASAGARPPDDDRGQARAIEDRLIDWVQSQFPLVRQPFAALAERLGCGESDVLEHLRRLHAPGGVIREISGIFDAVRLGYEQALIALRLPADRLDAAGDVVARHPGVSHCYARSAAYNLWFTLAVSPQSALGLAGTAARLADLAGAAGRLVLPTLRRYKLHVRFGSVERKPAPAPPIAPAGGGPPEVGDEQVRAIRALQSDLPLHRDPFAPPARQAGLEPDRLLAFAREFLAAGWMRRYAAVLYHRAAGAGANVLAVWRVDESAADAAGARCARHEAVSHCYLRPTRPGWPYGLYTMIHGPSREACEQTIRELASPPGLGEHAALWTAREYKKRRMRLFTGEESEWETGADRK